jgi:3-dehydroquinate dehydratase/shikimate dehydrogenase
MTQICVSLTEPTVAGTLERMHELQGLADMFEIRGDLIADLDLLTVLRAKTTPLLFTCRPAFEGGNWKGDEPRREQVLMEAVRRGFDYVDVEHRSEHLIEVMAQKAGAGLVISHHDYEGTPEDLNELYNAMCEQGADIVKLAVTPRSIADVGRLLEFAAVAANGGGAPVIPIAMGPMGMLTRVLAGRYGAPFTFASASLGAESAPGQISAGLMADLYRVRQVTASTKVYGVLGATATRTYSPYLHNRAFEACDIDAVFVPIETQDVASFVQVLAALDLAGFSVTRPFKETILPHLHEVDAIATGAGSVNTVIVEEGRLRGTSTDGRGVVEALRPHLPLAGQTVAILGAGGAARAAAHALLQERCRVVLLARRPEQAEAVAQALGCEHLPLESLTELGYDALINATPVGSATAPHQNLVTLEGVRQGTVVLDMVYEPLETPLLRQAASAGCVVLNGLEMLVPQAAAQFVAWTGREAPLAVLRETADLLAQARS